VFAVLVAVSAIARAADTAALAQRLHHAAEGSSLDDPSLKPWHFKLSFQLLDAKGKPTEEGTLEEWWASDADKRVYTSPSYTATEIVRGKTMYRTTGQTSPPYMLQLLRDQVVHPMAREDAVGGSTPDLRTESFGKIKLECIMLDQPMKNLAYLPLGLFPTYCFDLGEDRLRLSFNLGSEYISRNMLGNFQGRSVPIDTVVTVDTAVVASAHIDRLSGYTPDARAFEPSGDLVEQNAGVSKVDAGVIAREMITHVNPVYPLEAKMNHISGAVVLRALIGTDGYVHKLQVIEAPDASLAISAIAAVRRWRYKPYLLNGAPVSVDTTITVNYNFGPG
jgi:TonB family protein